MGYNTDFTGQLQFTHDLTIKQLVALEAICGEDCRDHPEWKDTQHCYYVDLQVTKDKDGLEWNEEAEKTYSMPKLVNVVLREMRKQWPEFGLKGHLLAQGDEVNDRWMLVIGEDGWAHKQPIMLEGDSITCPHCGKNFVRSHAIQEDK